jgi:hypothetical protein
MPSDLTPTPLAVQLPSIMGSLRARQGRCLHCGATLEGAQRWICPTCDESVKEAQAEQVRRQRAAGCEDALRAIGSIHDDALLRQPEIRPDEWSREAILWARAWNPGSAGAWLYGDCGSGKSTILGRLGRRLLDQGVSVAACSLQRMCGGLAELHFSRDLQGHRKALAALGSVRVLLLDDVLAHTPNRAELDELLAVLDQRWNAKLPVVATANLGPAPGLSAARQAWTTTDPVKPGRVLSRLEALTGVAVRCWYPGDRRIGSYDQGRAEQLRRIMQAEDEADRLPYGATSGEDNE